MFHVGVVAIAGATALVLWKRWARVRPEEARVRLLYEGPGMLRQPSGAARSYGDHR
jgi:hypothetical protein